MNAIQNFAFEEHLVRIVERDGAPWFVGNDICKALDLKNPRSSLDLLDDDEKGVHTMDTLGGAQTGIIVSEPGVYRLVFRSRKPEAERFKRWLAHEVLPQIRKTGRYGPAALPVEQVSPENGPVAELRARLDTVREARILFGPQRAAQLWRHLGLPEVPALVEGKREDAADCLDYLLACETRTGPLRDELDLALSGDVDARGRIRPHGLIVPSTLDGVYVASSHPAMAAFYEGTQWARRGWYKALLGIPGASRARTMNFGGRASHSLFLPLEALGEGA